jgi:tRNA threonylcarbamoyl adenosine modification protein YeaZ
MISLSLDTSSNSCSVACCEFSYEGDDSVFTILSSEQTSISRGHAEILAPMTQNVLAKAGISMDCIDSISTTIGPGTFMGVRIALSFAKGLSVANKIPIIGVSTLDAIAGNMFISIKNNTLYFKETDRNIVSLMDARKNQVYIKCFDKKFTPISDSYCVDYSEAMDLIPNSSVVLGSGLEVDNFSKYKSSFAKNDSFIHVPKAPVICYIANVLEKYTTNDNIKPDYIRSHNTQIPKHVM